MQPIDFVVHFSAMKHPNQWTILELTSNKCSHKIRNSKIIITKKNRGGKEDLNDE